MNRRSRQRLAERLFQLRLALPVLRARLQVEYLLRTQSLDTVVRQLTPVSPIVAPSRARHAVQVVRLAAPLRNRLLAAPLLPSTCLTRSLAMFSVLRHQGLEVDFVMGIRHNDRQELDGHAWLELDGEVLFEARDPSWKETFRHPCT